MLRSCRDDGADDECDGAMINGVLCRWCDDCDGDGVIA